jgi:hypothetical protein
MNADTANTRLLSLIKGLAIKKNVKQTSAILIKLFKSISMC